MNTNELVIDDELQKLRRKNSKAVRVYCKQRGFTDSKDYAQVQNRLNTLVGITSVDDCGDPKKLERRLELIEDVVQKYAIEKAAQT